jgi:uncharacterized protein
MIRQIRIHYLKYVIENLYRVQNNGSSMGYMEQLISSIKRKGKVAVAFSGGTDSTLVALAALKAQEGETIGLMIVNELLSKNEMTDARSIAEEISLELVTLEVDVFEDQDLINNGINRCGICRKGSMPGLISEARKRGFDTVADGANIDDLSDHRPGHLVSTELGIWHPLIENGIDKKTVRKILEKERISNHDRPSTPCLASRIPHDQRITREKLKIIDDIEMSIRKMGFRDVRLRLHESISGDLTGILEVDDLEKVMKIWNEINEITGSLKVVLDPMGYRQGSLNPGGPP